jgi:pimeloyl-ACP methyl ester carboxylesterase
MLRTFAGGELFGELWGPAPPRVLALHGWRRTHTDFVGVIGAASRAGPIAGAALDLPGFGASPPPPEAWGSADYAAAVVRVIEELTGSSAPVSGPTPTGAPASTPMVLLGHSFGGRVAVHVAAQRPDLVKALVLTGAPLARTAPARRAPRAFRFARAMRQMGLVPESTMEKMRRRYGSPDYLAAEGVMRQVLVRVLAENYDEQLEGLRCPVELVWADDDTEAPLRVAETVARLVPQATLTVIPSAGHLTPLSVPDRLRDAVDRMLEAQCDASTR